jgi:hypothetical protein
MNETFFIDIAEYRQKLEQLQHGIISNDDWMKYCSELRASIAAEKYLPTSINTCMAKGNNSQRKETKKPKKDKPAKPKK